ncbi:MAG: hypothetical protein V3U20_08805 [Thermoplasmata archaeon]
MEGQTPQGSENVPQEGTKSDYTPPPEDYSPPPEEYTQAYQGPPAQQPGTGSYPHAGAGPGRFRNTDKLVQLISMGLFLMFLGAIIIAAVTTTGGPNEFNEKYDDNNDGFMDGDQRDDYNRDRESYDSIRDVGVIVGKIVVNFGMLIVVLALFGGGLINKDLDKYVRLGMIIIAGLILIFSGLMV